MSAMSIESPAPVEEMIFEFERDFAGSLRCIPMIVRFKLDQCGVKLSLRQWSRFNHDDRAELVARPCMSSEQIADYRDLLVRLIETRANEAAIHLPVDTDPAWADLRKVPERVIHCTANLGLPLPNPEAWRTLSPLQRFALFKLTRPGHDNDNFEPAMLEFGLLGAPTSKGADFEDDR